MSGCEGMTAQGVKEGSVEKRKLMDHDDRVNDYYILKKAKNRK